MDSPTDLFDDSSPQIRTFTPGLSSADLPGVHTAPGFRPPGFPLIHHLLQPGGGPRRILTANQNEVTATQMEQEEGMMEGEDELMEVKRKCNDTVLMAEWSQDVMKVKRMKLECRQKDKQLEDGGKRREGRRREREELKEQLEEARERLQALQEKVWRAFGEKAEKKEKKRKRQRCDGDGDEVMVEDEEDVTGEMFDEEDIDGAEFEKESFSLLSVSHFDNFHKRKDELQKDRERQIERGREGDMEGVMEGSRLWLECGGLTRGDWDGGAEDEHEEGGQKFAQALKLELGSAVARVIDRVLRLYTEMMDHSSPPAAISFHPSDQQLKKLVPSGPDLAMPLAVHRSPDTRKTFPLLGPPLSTNINSSHPNLPLHHPSLTRPTPLPHPPLMPPASHPKETSSSTSFHPSSSSSSSSSSSFPAPPPPPPPLPLPLLHYSMQQLFSRSLHHPQLPHLAPSRKDYLNSDPFLEFSSHASFPPLPFLGHLDPSLTRHGVRERERGVRGDGRLCLFMFVLNQCHVYTQEGLSPCHLKKAKLMFFYTRYPSSNTLKTYFPDVKFNRCVTSQMIKWFSNFREFFYIQMERFARQAVRDYGSVTANQLRVGRDTELYRILNMHYNKSNVYQVPERFIEVSEVALREFYSAIWTGRDSDPCWKKGIYKIICKLDSPLPDAFRMPGCPVFLTHRIMFIQ
uniref:Prospero domain-containing protein n=1 Tax=Xiphophorus couchianus TaxID=32473 RepID=A0A3B5L2A5_9TELE